MRARINVLSEISDQWRECLFRRGRQNRKLKMIVDGRPAPSRNEAYLFYQTLVASWPFCSTTDEEFSEFRTRIKEYMLKAMPEATVHTNWISPYLLREDAVMYFIDTILKDTAPDSFLHDFASFQKSTAARNICNNYVFHFQTFFRCFPLLCWNLLTVL